MKIVEFLKQTLLDSSPGELAIEVFISDCNFSCPACHSRHIIFGEENYSEQEIFSYLDFAKGLIDEVVICGGEPTLQQDLEEFAEKLKEKNHLVKLDTNGYEPDVLDRLLRKKLIDYVALDIKAPRDLYLRIVGREDGDFDISRIEESMRILSQQNSKSYEFRTTVVPILRNAKEKIEWMGLGEVGEIGKWVYDTTKQNQSLWYLQPFVARTREEMMDERFSKENLQKEMHETPYELMEEMREKVRRYFPNCRIRGRE